MLKVAICDDDIQTTGKMDLLIEWVSQKNVIHTEIEVFWNGKSLIDAVVSGERFDIIFLDIEMERENGISVARKIRLYDKNVFIIYVTNHEHYMRETFSVRPFQFLIKPVSEQEMETCFKNAYKEIINGDYYFRYRYQRVNYKIPVGDS